MCYFVPNFLILVQPTSKVVFNALKSVTIPVLISYILLSDDVHSTSSNKYTEMHDCKELNCVPMFHSH